VGRLADRWVSDPGTWTERLIGAWKSDLMRNEIGGKVELRRRMLDSDMVS